MLDHLVYAAPDLDAAVAELAERFGVRAAPGGRHRGLGTHNALLALGEGAYLEVIAPDLSDPAPAGPRPFGLDTLDEPRLVTWAVKAQDIDGRVERARAAGYDPGNVLSLSRDLPDGGRLAWRLTFAPLAGDGLVPFLIDWGSSPHPADSAPRGCSLLSLRGEHPEPEMVQPPLRALEVELTVENGPAPALIATLQTPKGRAELR